MATAVETEIGDGPVQRCASHQHIRECFTVEMDRYMAVREPRFLEGTAPAFGELVDENELFTSFVSSAEPHDPRIRTMVELFMTARLSIPMGFDENDIPIMFPSPSSSTSESLDAIEAARLAMAHKALASRRAGQSRAAAQKAVILAFATMVYVKAIQRVYDLGGGRLGRLDRSRPSLDGLESAYETEKRVLLLTHQLIGAYRKDKLHAAVTAGAVDERLHRCRDVLTDDEREQAVINEDDLTAAAIASHAKCLHVAMAREGLRSRRAEQAEQAAIPTTGPAADFLSELRASGGGLRATPRAPPPSHNARQKVLVLQTSQQQRRQQMYAAAKARAVVKYMLAENALQVLKTECRNQRMRVPDIRFHIYPVRDRGRDTISFHVDQRMYGTDQRERVEKRWWKS